MLFLFVVAGWRNESACAKYCYFWRANFANVTAREQQIHENKENHFFTKITQKFCTSSFVGLCPRVADVDVEGIFTTQNRILTAFGARNDKLQYSITFMPPSALVRIGNLFSVNAAHEPTTTMGIWKIIAEKQQMWTYDRNKQLPKKKN